MYRQTLLQLCNPRLVVVALALALLAMPAARADWGPYYLGWLSGALVSPSAKGAEAGLAILLKPIAEREFFVGPHLSSLAAAGSDQTRLDLNTGIEGTMWIANAVGSGLSFDVVAPSTITGSESSVHYRIQPMLSVRFLRYSKEGAFALRVGVPYDTAYKWGFLAGISFQLNGVPEIGERD